MAEKTKPLTLRISEAEMAQVAEQVERSGYATRSDFLRAVLFESHFVFVSNAGFVLIPAFHADEAKRAEAEPLLELLLAAAQNLTQSAPAVDPAAEEEPPADGPGAGSIPDPGEDPSTAGGSSPALPPASPVPAVEGDFDPDDLLGPIQEPSSPPAELEPDEAYVARRTEELRLAGNSPLMAATLAEAENRQRHEPQAAAAAPARRPPGPRQEIPSERPRPDLVGSDGRTPCPACSTPGAGTGFCANCGANFALATPPQNGDGS